MSHHERLLTQARLLAGIDPVEARNATDLRRAVSSAYYAVFHFFVSEATNHFLGTPPGRKHARAGLTRAFGHGAMKQACECFALNEEMAEQLKRKVEKQKRAEEQRRKKELRRLARNPGDAAVEAVPAEPPAEIPITGRPEDVAPPGTRSVDIRSIGIVHVPERLERIAGNFVRLQEARHRADYNVMPEADFTSDEVRELVVMAKSTLDDWEPLRGTDDGYLFLTVLLLFSNMRE